MADTTALKNRIRAAIKANDNQEITGPVLQQTLLDMVDELDLYQKLQEAETQLGNRITNENNRALIEEARIEGRLDTNRFGYNVTVFGLVTGVHTLATAIKNVPHTERFGGQKITFKTDSGWVTYQNTSLVSSDYENVANWVLDSGVTELGDVTITNNPDYEDLTQNEGGQLKFADKEYNAATYSGLGRQYLRKNIANDVNTLTQEMMSDANTIYHIQYDFTLSEDITVPENCILEFDGGSISGVHTIIGQHTVIEATIVKIFNTDVVFGGSWNIKESYSEWFGGGNNTASDNIAIEKAASILTSGGIIRLLSKKYYASHIELPVGVSVIGSYSRNIEDINHGTIVCCHNTTSSPVFKLNSGCRLQGVTLYYPNQNPTTPIEYYWAIEVADESGYVTIKDILFLCVFRGIYCPGTHDCLVLEDVYGHVMKTGIYSVFARDVDKYTNVQLTYAPLLQHLYKSGVMTYDEAYQYGDYTVANGIAFRVRRGDLTTLENCFALGFKIAIWLGNDIRYNSLVGSRLIINNFGSDGNQQFLRCIDFGNVYVNNCMMTQFNGVRITPTDVEDIKAAIHIIGKVVNIRFNNCLFMGTSDSSIVFDAYDEEDTITIANSYFSVSSLIKSKYKAFLEMYRGSALISNCIFKGGSGEGNVNQIQGINFNNSTKAYLNNIKFVNFKETNTFNVNSNTFLRISNAEYLNCRINNEAEDKRLEKIIGNINNRPTSPVYGFQYFDSTLGKPIFWVNKWVDATGVLSDTPTNGTFANKPTVSNNAIPIGFRYFCTDKQTTEGATDGIEIIHKGNDVWVDALGRVVS